MLKRKTKATAQNAIGFHEDGICYASVDRISSEKPSIVALEFFPCNEDEYPITLNALVKKYKLKNTTCFSFLNHDAYKLLVTEAPDVPDELMVDAVQWEVKDLVGFPLEEATLDVFPVPDHASTKKNINVVAARKEVIQARADLFEEASLNLNVIDIEEMAFRNIAATQEKEAQGSVIIVLRKNHGLVLFCRGGELHFSRRLAEGFEILNEDESRIESIALEIQRSIDFFDRHFTEIGMNNLILFPYGNTEYFAANFLDKNLTLPCTMLDLNQGLEWEVSADLLDQSRCLLALGAALRCEDDAE